MRPSNGWGGGLRKVVGSALHPSHHARPTCAGQKEGRPEPLPLPHQEGPCPRQMGRVLPVPCRAPASATAPHRPQLIRTRSRPGRPCPQQHHSHFTDEETEPRSGEASFSGPPRESHWWAGGGAHRAGGRQCAMETLRGPLAPGPREVTPSRHPPCASHPPPAPWHSHPSRPCCRTGTVTIPIPQGGKQAQPGQPFAQSHKAPQPDRILPSQPVLELGVFPTIS